MGAPAIKQNARPEAGRFPSHRRKVEAYFAALPLAAAAKPSYGLKASFATFA
jgi:hypothetical protein